MPKDAKLGLVTGLAVVVLIAMTYYRKDPAGGTTSEPVSATEHKPAEKQAAPPVQPPSVPSPPAEPVPVPPPPARAPEEDPFAPENSRSLPLPPPPMPMNDNSGPALPPPLPSFLPTPPR